MEDHGGEVLLEERAATPAWPGGGALVTLILPGGQASGLPAKSEA
jgi:hypothetical protein